MKISEVILKLTKFHPPVNEQHTCDTVKCGNPNQECTARANREESRSMMI